MGARERLMRASWYAPIVAKEKRDGGLWFRACMIKEGVDSQGEIVDYDGAKKASGSWFGNVIEEHNSPLRRAETVGKSVEVFWDDAKREAWVEGFVSDGAPRTQTKLLDGTLSGVSVEGEVEKDDSGKPTGRIITKADDALVEKYRLPGVMKGRPIKILRDWRQTALALVGAPANGERLEIIKSADGALLIQDAAAVAKEGPMAAEEMPAAPASEPAAQAPEASDGLALLGQIKELAAKLAQLKAADVAEECPGELADAVGLLQQIEWMKQRELADVADEAVEVAEGAEPMSEPMKSAETTAPTVAKAKADPLAQAVVDACAAAVDACQKYAEAHPVAKAAVEPCVAACQKTAEAVQGAAAEEDNSPDGEPAGDAKPAEEPMKSQAVTFDVNAFVAKAQEDLGATVTKAVADVLAPFSGQLAAVIADVEAMKKLPRPGGPARVVADRVTVAKGAIGEPISLEAQIAALPSGLTPDQARQRLIASITK